MDKANQDFKPTVLVVSGSSQKQGQSLKVANYIRVLLEQAKRAEVHLLDLHELDLPAFGCHDKHQHWQAPWRKVEGWLKAANGLVLVSPEYNGGPSPVLLNLMLYVGDNLAHKPVLTVGVSAGRGGAYPLAALRQNGFKDPAYVIIPPSVIVSHVGSVLNDSGVIGEDGSLSEAENDLRRQLDEAADVLLAYSRALAGLRLILSE